MAYNYEQELKDDVLNVAPEYIDNLSEEQRAAYKEDPDEFVQYLNDELWTDDSVTGNGSGSYTFDREKAKQYAIDNLDLYVDAENEFGGDFHYLKDNDWEAIDVTIRCWLLYQVLWDLKDDLVKML